MCQAKDRARNVNVQDSLNLQILNVLEGIFSFNAAQII